MDAKDYQHVFQIIAGILVLLLGSLFLQPEEEEQPVFAEILVDGTIDRVIDGDTVDVVVGREVIRARLIGIDTPETVDPRKEVQCFGLEATRHLKDLLADQKVTVEYDESQGLVDKYDRALVYLKLADGTDVGEQMLRDGFAYEYTYDNPYKYQELFKNAEQDARDSERGLWSRETCGGNR
ncbi:MAG: thermonuclease family protein [Patescibacteria group bacterium]